jgi:hypothetical protein
MENFMFISIVPIYLNPHTNKYEKADNTIEINVSAIEAIYTPSKSAKRDHYTIWLKGRTHQDIIKTFDRPYFVKVGEK